MFVNVNEPTLAKLLALLADCGWADMDKADMNAIADRAECCFNCGASKGVFWRGDWDFVIKVPLYSRGASYDYCQREVDAYDKILADYPDCACLFAETCYIGKYGELYVYAQRKVNSTLADFYSDKLEDIKWWSNFSRKCYGQLPKFPLVSKRYSRLCASRLNKVFFMLVLWKFGVKALRSLCNWIEDTEQNDLHDNNVGLNDNHTPVIFDFSGFDG